LADTPIISIGNNSVTIPISSLFDSQEEEFKSLNVESKDYDDIISSGSSWTDPSRALVGMLIAAVGFGLV
jgi:hypothetical protein